MLDKTEIIDSPRQLTAVIHLTVPASEIMKVMGAGIGEVREKVAAQGLKVSGAWFTHHFKVPDSTFDFEVGVVVPAEVKPAGRVKPGTLPAGKVAHAVYHGPYEKLGSAWGEFMKWIEAQGHTPKGDLWEVYVTGPDSNPDPKTWRTEFYRPLN
ncbi:MAG: GyrI-like domain-containing protein [Rhodospirillaceae bacterium]|nr:GyrI-like domain-containing protein [Rhodospirillaceae bacterium]